MEPIYCKECGKQIISKEDYKPLLFKDICNECHNIKFEKLGSLKFLFYLRDPVITSYYYYFHPVILILIISFILFFSLIHNNLKLTIYSTLAIIFILTGYYLKYKYTIGKISQLN